MNKAPHYRPDATHQIPSKRHTPYGYRPWIEYNCFFFLKTSLLGINKTQTQSMYIQSDKLPSSRMKLILELRNLNENK